LKQKRRRKQFALRLDIIFITTHLLCQLIPAFDPDTGNLPRGIHDASWNEVKARLGGTPRRQRLLEGLEQALRNLAEAGCASVLLDDSFVTAKAEPNDYDGAWEPGGVDPDLLDEVLLDFSNARAAMKRKYGGEMFPAGWPAAPGTLFRECFQHDRQGRPKGIVRIDPRDAT
jgi:hypothetical protein